MEIDFEEYDKEREKNKSKFLLAVKPLINTIPVSKSLRMRDAQEMIGMYAFYKKIFDETVKQIGENEFELIME